MNDYIFNIGVRVKGEHSKWGREVRHNHIFPVCADNITAAFEQAEKHIRDRTDASALLIYEIMSVEKL